ncbi:lycopene beta-cyclase [Novosphingobium sp. PhB165]|uniref:lycopene beta-cyclase CrtY n=1 Tax=Novosphingobium sp. PhB165 TaxID=2485105 RepID=UPI00104E7ADC|nr:lycopene beta-cyclase CrtY [Novosphingobium sp. PhB165]TCM19811.1 lycopene beta-cyclase [Novosphingobium sp. PhB165]
MTARTCNLAILGGGLAGALIALAMARHRPDLRVLLIERGNTLGGEHVWSFFESDLNAEGRALVEPLVAARWPGYDIHFPAFSRRLSTPYASVTSDRLDSAVRAALPAEAVLTGADVHHATPVSVTLADGTEIAADAVIDARGARALPHMAGGWQKFAGQMLRLSAPHGLDRPVVMDARVEQVDGYRFVYALPFSPTEVFVEDTYYADSPVLDLPVLHARIADYARQRGWQVAAVDYQETGVLPVIAAGDFEAFWAATGEPEMARAGTRAALVHPLTSYSLPDAVRFAHHLTTLDNLSGNSLGRASHAWAANHWRGGRYYRMLTRMLFAAAPPGARWRVLERFYRLPEPLVERFYAGRSTLADRARLLIGRPPVPVGAALASLSGGGRALADLGADFGITREPSR